MYVMRGSNPKIRHNPIEKLLKNSDVRKTVV